MTRRRLLPLFALLSHIVLFDSILLNCTTAQTQDTVPPSPESLLDKMTGKWVMTGTIDKEQVTHDVDVDWILNRRYIRIHEVSREKNTDGELAYEAWIHIAWDPKNGDYVEIGRAHV